MSVVGSILAPGSTVAPLTDGFIKLSDIKGGRGGGQTRFRKAGVSEDLMPALGMHDSIACIVGGGSSDGDGWHNDDDCHVKQSGFFAQGLHNNGAFLPNFPPGSLNIRKD